VKSLGSKTILITGAAGTIGSTLAGSFVETGCVVFCTDIVSKNYSDKFFFEGDLSDDVVFNDFKSWLTNKSIDVLVNCIGVTKSSKYNFDEENFDYTLKVNLKIPFKLCGSLITQALNMNSKLSIINITSLGAHQGFPMNPSYQVSKAGLSQLTRSISVDYSKNGIRANNVVPGYIKSNMTIDSYNSEIKRVERINRSSMKRWGEPSDLIGAVHFLSSDESSFVTGADIFVDGGWNINGL
jgi:NAD(P)-dependent dehydrogenase (short-subunit alcohol dehydrogenase family)